MEIRQLLSEHRTAILEAWRDSMAASPAAGAAELGEKQNALLADATGSDLSQGMAGLFDALLAGVIPDSGSRFLEGLIRARAAGDINAAPAVAFVFDLKKAARKELGAEILRDPRLREELHQWEAAVDDLALFVFDLYVRSRESVLELKAEESIKETLRLLRKAKLIGDGQG